jgi:hypothetical protein
MICRRKNVETCKCTHVHARTLAMGREKTDARFGLTPQRSQHPLSSELHPFHTIHFRDKSFHRLRSPSHASLCTTIDVLRLIPSEDSKIQVNNSSSDASDGCTMSMLPQEVSNPNCANCCPADWRQTNPSVIATPSSKCAAHAQAAGKVSTVLQTPKHFTGPRNLQHPLLGIRMHDRQCLGRSGGNNSERSLNPLLGLS